MTKKELPHKKLLRNKTNVLEAYMPKIDREINCEVHRFKDKDGEFIRYYGEGSIAYSKELR